MNIKGFMKSSYIDFPGRISSVIFTGGCNMRCPYCHNKELVENKGKEIPEEYIIKTLLLRKEFINSVVISGGEPTIHKDLPEFIKKLKGFGFFIKLDTNGTNPEMLKNLIENNLLDYVAMDIKNSFKRYEKVTVLKISIENIKKSMEILRKNNVNYEFRTTICKELTKIEDIEKIASMIKKDEKFYLQNFRNSEYIQKNIKLTPYSDEELAFFERKYKRNFTDFNIR